MELIELSSFYQIVKTGSFSKASENIFRTQSAVSHHIKNLEAELQVKLFERLGKTIRLTKEGEVLLDIVSRFFADLGDLKRIYSDIKHETGGLAIATTNTVANYSFHDTIKSFMKLYPGTKFRLIICNLTLEIQGLVLNCEVDFGIAVKPKESIPPRLAYFSWQTFDMMLVTSKGHPLAQKKDLGIADIASFPLILYRRGARTREIIDDTFTKNNLPYNVVIEIDLSEDIKTYVGMGLGVTILPSLTIFPRDKKRFFVANVTNLFDPIDYGVYYRQGRYISAPMRHFFRMFSPQLLNKFA